MKNDLAKQAVMQKEDDKEVSPTEQGMVVTKEEFPDLDALDAPAKRKLKKPKNVKWKVVPVLTAKEEEEKKAREEELEKMKESKVESILPHKGKPSKFFILTFMKEGTALNSDVNPYNYEMNDE